MGVHRRNNAWWIDYYCQGRRYRQKIGSRRKDAEEAFSRIKVQIAAGEFVAPQERKRLELLAEPTPIKFEDFACQQFVPWSKAEHSRNHHNQQKMILRAHLVPYMEGLRLHEITSRRAENYKAKRSREVGRSTVNREVCCLRRVLGKAVEWGYLEENPAAVVKMYKETPQTPRLLEVEEVAALLTACRKEPASLDLHAFVACMVYAGLRKSEVLNLRWAWIDWRREEVTVRSLPEWHTKSYQSRGIPLSPLLAVAIRRVPRRLNSSLVFPTPDGEAYQNTHYIQAALNEAAKAAGIVEQQVTFHQLRHCFCSHAQMQGVPPRTVQKWMGHSDLRTTLRYSHVSADHEKAAMRGFSYVHSDGDVQSEMVS